MSSKARKQSTAKSVPEQCDEWLTTRNKRKATPLQRPIKKHKAYSAPLKETTRENQLFLLTQNSPPPPQLKTCTKQSDITSFFMSPNLTGPPDKDKFPVRSLFEDETSNDVVCFSDDSEYDNQKENHSFEYDESVRFHIDKGDYSSKKCVKDRKIDDITCLSTEKKHNFTEQSFKLKSNTSRDLINKENIVRRSPINSNRVQISTRLMEDINLELEEQEGSSSNKIERNTHEVIVQDNKRSEVKQKLTCDRFTCQVCSDDESESLDFSCGHHHRFGKESYQSGSSQLINSEEADQELDNFSLSFNTQYNT
ncbi:uncharacterized protein [Argopecten irradians]|uniref:uncharacterized protein n=1 Tax=Argopecten irradians TaxID=31199 RepID=UPI003718FF12